MLKERPESGVGLPPPALIGVDEFQPVIPRRVALQQSPPPLRRPRSECDKVILPVETLAANGEPCLIWLSQPRGQPHSSLTRSVSQHRRDAAISIPSILAGRRDDRLRQRIFVLSLCRLVALRAAWLIHQPARTPLAQALFLSMVRRTAPTLRA